MRKEKSLAKSRTCYQPALVATFEKFDNNIDKLLKMCCMQDNYKEATLLIPKRVGATWFIIWYNFNPATGKMERIRKTFDLNRIENIKQRKQKGYEMCAILNVALKNGYNFFEQADPPQQEKTVPARIEENNRAAAGVTLVFALNKALRIRLTGKKDRTYTTYTSFVTCLIDWLTSCDQKGMPLQSFTAEHFREYLFYKYELGHKNRNLNDHLNFFKTTFEIIRVELKLITVNPLDGLKYLNEGESSLFQPLTSEEITQIVPVLLAHNPRFYLFVKFIPHEFIRPHHIARLRAGDILYNENLIRVTEDTTKNNKNSYKQLLTPVKEKLIELGYDKLPATHYLFANKNFEPGPKLFKSMSVRAAELWRVLVIEGLKIEKKMYALKHSSAQYFVNNNEQIDMFWLMQQLEHSNAAQTQIYLQNKVRKKKDESGMNTLDF